MRAPFVPHLCASVLALLLVSGVSRAQTTWYVDDGAVAPGLGTLHEPYASVQYAIDRPTTLTGDTLLVLPGTYVERLSLVKQISVRSTAGPLWTRLVRPAGSGGTHVFMGPMDTEASVSLVGFTITGTVGVLTSVNMHGGTLERCIVAGNGGLAVSSIFGRIKHCTIADNAMGVQFATFGETALENSIVWGNAPDILGVGGFGTARYTTYGTESGSVMSSAGPGNEIADPLFLDAAAGDYRLRRTSPCIDTADPFSHPDPGGSRADRGALAFRQLFRVLQR